MNNLLANPAGSPYLPQSSVMPDDSQSLLAF
jgi:hypothetical protein